MFFCVLSKFKVFNKEGGFMKIILIRHGEYDKDGFTGGGKRQIQESALKLKNDGYFSEGEKVFLATSPLKRAKQSAEIEVNVLGMEIPVLEMESLADDLGFFETWKMIKEEMGNFDVFLFTTHLEYIIDFPEFFEIQMSEKGEVSCEFTNKKAKGSICLLECF